MFVDYRLHRVSLGVARCGDILLQAVSWLLLTSLGGQGLIFIGLMLWMAWTDAIKPRLISADDIDRVADDIIANYPDP